MISFNILFVGCLYSENQKDIFLHNSKRGYQYAAQNLQESLIDGFLSNNVNLRVLTIPSLSSFPFGYKKPYVANSDFYYKKQIIGKSLGFNNIVLFRNSPRRKFMNYVNRWINETSGKRYVVVYGLHRNLLENALNIKSKYKDVKICVVVPDLPQFMGCNKYYKLLGLQKRDIKNIYSKLSSFDAFVVLAKPMIDMMGIKNIPYVVVEGIYSNNYIVEVEKDPHKVILYTGNLSAKYGIIQLLEAFSMIKDSNYRLWIRGDGGTKGMIEKMSKVDSRIKYLCPLAKEELLKLQKRATLLINPVSPSQDFTRYFFPSKTMDYLASGTPVLMYKLDCLPIEYYKHLYFIENEDVFELSMAIKHICEKPFLSLQQKGFEASEFIRTQKNPQMQVGKILNMLSNID